MGLTKLGDSKTAVGIDIGTNAIRVAYLKHSKGLAELINYGSIAVPKNAIIDGEVADIAAVSASLKELWKVLGIKEKEVVVGIANQKVIVRLIDLPYMDPSDLQGALQYQAQDYIAIPVEEAILDFDILRDYVTEDDRHMMDVLLVAAHRGMVYGFVDAVEGAGLEPLSIDVSSFALVRSLCEPVPVVPTEEGSARVIMDIGFGTTNIIVTEGLNPKFTRIMPIAGKAFTDPLVETFHVTFEEAERIKIKLGLPSLTEENREEKKNQPVVEASEPSPQLMPNTEKSNDSEKDQALVSSEEVMSSSDASIDKFNKVVSDSGKIQQARMLLEQKAVQFSEETRRSLDYYTAQTKSSKLREIILTGNGSKLINFEQYISKSLQMEVVIGDPFKHIKVPEKLKALVENDRLSIAVSIGLALGGIGQ